jgi:hypothetical protein
MEKDVKDFINNTSKKLVAIEKKIKEMKLNIVIMSFYTDLKLIEDTLLTYQSQGIDIDESLFEKIEKFKILLQSKQNLPTLGKKFIEVTEEFYKLRKQIGDNNNKIKDFNKNKCSKGSKIKKKTLDEFLLAYN